MSYGFFRVNIGKIIRGHFPARKGRDRYGMKRYRINVDEELGNKKYLSGVYPFFCIVPGDIFQEIFEEIRRKIKYIEKL